MRSERVLVVSPRKSGTHLAQEMMMLFDYYVHGESVTPTSGRVALSMRDRISLAEHFLHPSELKKLNGETRQEEYVGVTDLLWFQVASMWTLKLAATSASNTELSFPTLNDQVPMHPEAWQRPFSDTPPNICWVTHSIDVWRMDWNFCHEWEIEDSPRMVLNYRDPRDVLISMVNFFSGESGHEFTRQPERAIYRPVLQNMSDMSDRITYLLRDPDCPLLRDFESAMTLLHHPRVCTVSFEELVGAEGGGTADVQTAAVARVAEHLGADIDPEVVAHKMFNPKAWSFHRGQIGTWRDAFTSQHCRMFEKRFGHLLEVFDYA